jgi:hypothetical protein
LYLLGGGVLAYTLLGIRREKSTEKIEYLILDPHYPCLFVVVVVFLAILMFF